MSNLTLKSSLLICVVSLSACGMQQNDHQARSAQANTYAQGPALSVHHYGMSVPNVEDTAEWYESNLGFVVKQPKTHAPEVGASVMLLEKNGFILELYEKKGSYTPKKPMPKNVPQDLMVRGPKHIAFMTTDVDGLAYDLKAKGVKFLQGPTDLKSTGLRVINIFDNNNNVVEIAQKL